MESKKPNLRDSMLSSENPRPDHGRAVSVSEKEMISVPA